MGGPLTRSIPATAEPEGARIALCFEGAVRPDYELAADDEELPDSLGVTGATASDAGAWSRGATNTAPLHASARLASAPADDGEQ